MTAQTRHRALKASRQEIAARPLPKASHLAVQQTHARQPYRFLRTGLAELAAPPVPVTGSPQPGRDQPRLHQRHR